VVLAVFITLGLETIERPYAPLALLIEASCAGVMSGLVKPVGYMTGAGFAVWIATGFSRRVRFQYTILFAPIFHQALASERPYGVTQGHCSGQKIVPRAKWR
jgi:hypothetical protein